MASSTTDTEALRILIAVDEGRLYRNKRGRFEIDREEPPDRRTRERLRRQRFIVPVYGNDGYRLTATGAAELQAGLRRLRADRNARLLAAQSGTFKAGE